MNIKILFENFQTNRIEENNKCRNVTEVKLQFQMYRSKLYSLIVIYWNKKIYDISQKSFIWIGMNSVLSYSIHHRNLNLEEF